MTEFGYSFTSYQYDLPSGTSSVIGYDSNLSQVITKANYSITENHSFL